MENKNFIIVGQQPWDTDIGSNCKDIALEFSKQNRVLYVNSPLDRATAIRKRSTDGVQRRLKVIRREVDGLVQLGENLWNYDPDCLVESINWLTFPWLFDRLNRRNNQLFARSILSAAKRLGFDRYYLFNDNEIIKCFYLTELLNPVLRIYYSRDYILATPYWKRNGTRLEPSVIAANDLCVANSMYLADYCRQYNPRSFYVGQGCDISLFEEGMSAALPPELVALSGRTVIGYVGALHGQRLDEALLLKMAELRPDWTIILVGPEDEVFRRSLLHNYPNVFFTGKKELKELPAYIRGFDVCINPQVVNELTIGNYPRKVDEYLAMGKPVVATKTRAMEAFADHVYLADTRDEFLDMIDRALKENDERKTEARRAFAGSHTWANSVQAIYEAINEVGQFDRTEQHV